MRTTATFLAILGVCAGGAFAAAGSGVTITPTEGGDALEVRIDGEHFTTYHYSNEAKKPYLWPVLGEGGVPVTRGWPMGEKEISADHPHHKSMWTSYGEVNGADCWGEGDNSGFQYSNEVTHESGDEFGCIKAKNTWLANDRTPVVVEEREYRFLATPANARLFDLKVTFTASYGDVEFKDTKEGGIMAVRVRDAITEQNGGTITNALGGTGAGACWGKPSPWCDYSGPIEGAGVRGVAVFDHPDNLRHPSRWHVRNYGLMGANCFGLSYFTEKEPERLNGDYQMKAGETLTFQYRVYVHSGDVKEAQVAERYAEYAGPATEADEPDKAEKKRSKREGS